MDIRDRRGCKASAQRALSEASGTPEKLILVYTGVTLGISLLYILFDFLLEDQISGTGGLGGIGMRSVLSTIQTVLQMARTVFLPFWNMGYLFTMMRIGRGEEANTGSLLEGFRRWGPVLRLTLLTALLYLAIFFVCGYIGTMIFVMTPFANSLMDMDVTALYNTGDMSELYAAIAAPEILIPLLLFMAAVILVVAIPIFYRLRFSGYCLLDGTEGKALLAMRKSFRLTRCRKFAIFKLDLSFWWFYLLEVLVMVLNYMDLILAAAGVALPWSAEVSYVLAFLLYGVCLLGLYRWRKNQVEMTYFMAYEAARGK